MSGGARRAVSTLAVGAVAGSGLLIHAAVGLPAKAVAGSLIAFASSPTEVGKRDIYVMRTNGSHIRRLASVGHAEGELAGPAWSPDGQKIAFAAGPRLPRSDIYVMNADGAGVRRLTRDSFSADPDWSPDGKKLVFDSGAGIDVMNADGRGRRTLIKDLGGGNFGSPAWSPDGAENRLQHPGRRPGLGHLSSQR
jgi:Tol biopolymer transport system component